MGHVEIAVSLNPVLVSFHAQCAYQSQKSCLIGEDSYNMAATLQFLIKAFEHVGALDVFMMGMREAVKGEGL